MFLNFIITTLILYKINSQNYNEYKPVIGIYGNPYPDNDENKGNISYYPGAIIRFLESFGAETLPIHQWYNESFIDDILNKINGIIFIPGLRNLNKNYNWEKKSLYIINKGKKNNLAIWGICEGFELIVSLISDDFSILKSGYQDLSVYHGIYNITNNSRIFSLFDNKSIEILLNNKPLLYHHEKGFDKNDFLNNNNLSNEFIISSMADDIKGKFFVNSIESSNKSENIFGFQFHNEYIIYQRTKNSSLFNEHNAIKIVTLFNSFIVETARKNKNKFPKENREFYNFFDLYSNTTKYNSYDKDNDIFYFYKPKVEVNIHILPLIVIIFFECIVLFTIGNAFYHFCYKYEKVEINENEDQQKLITEND